MTPKVAVLSGFGINCETETAAVFEMAGASADRIHLNRLVGVTPTYLNTRFLPFQGVSPSETTSAAGDCSETG